jgi:drug/metabolite transporter (DMT)-like permease
MFMVVYGLVVAIFNSMWTLSVQYNGAAVATVMAFSSPAMTAILSSIIHKETFSGIKIISILLSLAGIIFVSGAYDISVWNLNPLGIIFGLLTGLMFAVYNLQGKAAADRHIDSWTALLYSFAGQPYFYFSSTLGMTCSSQTEPCLPICSGSGIPFQAGEFFSFSALSPHLVGLGFTH